jgi:tRNA dimethylallyltransferase
MSIKPKLIAVVGPTASGKTSLGIALAESFNGEIVSADSRQIYRGMDIGTAKASRAELAAIPHHLVDIRNPDEDYTVADFKRDAIAAIDDILSRGKTPFLVGGTGLYIKAVVDNLDIPEIKADPKLRHEIESEIAAEGLPAVFEKLVSLDPEAAYIVDPNNPRRVVRALEVAMITGEPFTAQRRAQEPRYAVCELGIDAAPDILRERIDQRIDAMVRDGLVDEVKRLLKKYRRADGGFPTSFDAIGYREIIAYLNGVNSLETAVAAMKLNTWHFAKRQMTWFRKDIRIQWVTDKLEAADRAKQFLKKD